MRARAFFRSAKIMLPGAVIGATFGPGFSADLSSWRLAIDERGMLFQDTRVWRWTREAGIIQEQRQDQVHIGTEAVVSLLLTAEEVGFHSYKQSYNVTADDAPSYRISIRFGEADTTVSAGAASWLAREGNADMKGFMELWREIHQHAPFPQHLGPES